MATKLKDLKVTKVDFVTAGANPKADIKLFKSKDGKTEEKDEPKSILKKIYSALQKIAGVEETESITKSQDAETFGEKMAERKMRRVSDQIWDTSYALEESLNSILFDDNVTVDQKPVLMQQSLDEFTEAVKSLIGLWAAGKTAESVAKSDLPINPVRLEIAKSARDKLIAFITKAESQEKPEKPVTKTTEIPEGENKDMKIDKSKLTPEEIATLDAIEKKAGIQEETPPAGNTATGVEKGATPPATVPATGSTGEDEDIFKGLNPAVKAEFERLRKSAEAAEDRELTDVAKKYELLGKKPEELKPILKSIKGTAAYDQMIAILDTSLEAVNKSGVFSEIGKNGSGSFVGPEEAANKHADEIQKAMPQLTRAQALAKAWEQHPELVSEYEKDR